MNWVLRMPRNRYHGGKEMITEDRSDWRWLCQQAAEETDLAKLLELAAEITRLLDDQREKSIGHAAGSGLESMN